MESSEANQGTNMSEFLRLERQFTIFLESTNRIWSRLNSQRRKDWLAELQELSLGYQRSLTISLECVNQDIKAIDSYLCLHGKDPSPSELYGTDWNVSTDPASPEPEEKTTGSTTPSTPSESQDGPSINPEHYKSESLIGVEVHDIFIGLCRNKDELRGGLKGPMVKYLYRYLAKGSPVENLKKCRWYLNKLIDLEERWAGE